MAHLKALCSYAAPQHRPPHAYVPKQNATSGGPQQLQILIPNSTHAQDIGIIFPRVRNVRVRPGQTRASGCQVRGEMGIQGVSQGTPKQLGSAILSIRMELNTKRMPSVAISHRDKATSTGIPLPLTTPVHASACTFQSMCYGGARHSIRLKEQEV